MPEGIPVVAALEGTVRLARGDSSVGGCDPKFARFANYVVLSHANGLETQYLHFSQVVVKEGERVEAGALLGYSGSTGWACGSHLHFKVAQPLTPGWNNPSVPARLAGYGDPERGVVITAAPCTGEAVLAQQSPGPQAPVASARASPTSATGSSNLIQLDAPASLPLPAPGVAPDAVAPLPTADAT